jgi:hypothetical protein
MQKEVTWAEYYPLKTRKIYLFYYEIASLCSQRRLKDFFNRLTRADPQMFSAEGTVPERRKKKDLPKQIVTGVKFWLMTPVLQGRRLR